MTRTNDGQTGGEGRGEGGRRGTVRIGALIAPRAGRVECLDRGSSTMRARPLDFLAERLIFFWLPVKGREIRSDVGGGSERKSDFPRSNPRDRSHRESCAGARNYRTYRHGIVEDARASAAGCDPSRPPKPREDANPPRRDPSIILC